MQMCKSTHCISPSTFILSTILGPPWPPRLAMPCSAWGELHWLTSDPASNSHLSEVLYLRTLKANIVFFSSSYTVKFAGQTYDNIKLCWKQETRRKWSSVSVQLIKISRKKAVSVEWRQESYVHFVQFMWVWCISWHCTERRGWDTHISDMGYSSFQKHASPFQTALTESSGNAFMPITQQQREDICSCGTPYLHHTGKTLTLQTASCCVALKNKIHDYVRVCFSQLCSVVKY